MPARNLLLACLAVHHGDDIVIGAMRDDHSVDKTPSALRAMSRILSDQAGRDIRVRAPLADLYKSEAVEQYVSTCPPRLQRLARMVRTWSCHGPGPERCLRCKECFRWSVALRSAGVDVPAPDDDSFREMLPRLSVLSDQERGSVVRAMRSWGLRLAILPTEEAAHSGQPRAKFLIVTDSGPESQRTAVEMDLASRFIRYDALLMDVVRG